MKRNVLVTGSASIAMLLAGTLTAFQAHASEDMFDSILDYLHSKNTTPAFVMNALPSGRIQVAGCPDQNNLSSCEIIGNPAGYELGDLEDFHPTVRKASADVELAVVAIVSVGTFGSGDAAGGGVAEGATSMGGAILRALLPSSVTGAASAAVHDLDPLHQYRFATMSEILEDGAEKIHGGEQNVVYNVDLTSSWNKIEFGITRDKYSKARETMLDLLKELPSNDTTPARE